MTMLRALEQRRRVVAEAKTWLRTPYHPHARIKGVGVDCAHLLIGVFAGAGLIEQLDPGYYAPDWHLHRNEERYIEWMDRYGRRIPADLWRPGDVALFRFGRTYSHSAVMVAADGSAIHAYVGRGVIESRLDEDPLQGRPAMFWSLIE